MSAKQGTRQQQDAAKVRHLGKKPHARGHCELCRGEQN